MLGDMSVALAAKVLSIQTGRPKTYQLPNGGSWRSALEKGAALEPVRLHSDHLEGDQVADTRHHGGPDKAMLLYPAAHYPRWKDEYGWNFPYGGLGENLTVSGLEEESVCIGDVYRLGEGHDAVELQVTQPREPCNNLDRYWNNPQLASLARELNRTGWYVRVLRPGELRSGMALELLDRPNPDWSIARASNVFYRRKELLQTAAELRACPGLSARWQERLAPRP